MSNEPAAHISRFTPYTHSTHVYSVRELALHIGSVLEAEPGLQDVWVRGEVVNLSRSPAGHAYFALKDDTAQLRCVLCRGSAFNSPVRPVNGLALVGNTSRIKDGQEIRAAGSLNSSANGGTLTASSINVMADLGASNTVTGYTELQGIVTSVLSTSTATPTKVTRLKLGSNVIDITNAEISPAGASIKEGTRIEVEGTWRAGVLLATEVEIKTEQQSQEVEIEAVIEQFASVANFVVRGQRCDASGITSVGNGRLSDLKLGTRVELHGRKIGDVVRVTELEIK